MPIKKPVAGVAMGLIKDVDNGNIAVLTDIQGLSLIHISSAHHAQNRGHHPRGDGCHRRPGSAAVSYTHLDVYKRQLLEQERMIFAGDTLFRLSVGRSDLKGGNEQELYESIAYTLFPLPGDYDCLLYTSRCV